MGQYIYLFRAGNKDMKSLLGGKGANLAEMTNLGLPVPPGFTITTEACLEYLKHDFLPKNLENELITALRTLELETGRKFGDTENPLLVSVRSGAVHSMPGMMDTILNLGLNDETVIALTKQTSNPRFAYDAYRRFITMFGDVVLGIDHDKFEALLDQIKDKKGASLDTDLDVDDLKNLCELYKQLVEKETSNEFPKQPLVQLKKAIEAVFNSWNNERAIYYRKMHSIPHNLGTAVNIQSMVFGNMGNDSGTGVAFTRNPSTGEKEFYGEYLMNAQGEDVVAGIRTPQALDMLQKDLPQVYSQLNDIREKLESHYKDMQDLEFTIEKGYLFILQTRNGKRTAQAGIKIAHDMVQERLLSKEEALLKINPKQLVQLLHPYIDPSAKKQVIAKGLPASPGACSGKIVFTADSAYEWAENGEKVILVRKETCPEDIHGMHASVGILTSMGGMTSHAAVVARGMGKCCITGCQDLQVNKHEKKLIIKELILKEGDEITLDGSTGEVILGKTAMKDPCFSDEFNLLMAFADEYRRLKIRSNADTPKDSAVARNFGAEGIGLCRTEHMFFEDDRIDKMREMILSKTKEEREHSLQELLPLQVEDFKKIFKVMDGLPVLIRLLDPPLHEFMPENDQKIALLAREMNVPVEKLRDVIADLHEINPMLGHRGCRLGITYPEIYEMQISAIFQAAHESTASGISVNVEIEAPFVSEIEEIKAFKKQVAKVEEKMQDNINFNYKIGTMIELPRACLIGNKLASEVDFLSFGTNDLTQMTYGISRDDAGKFLNYYLENGIFEFNPTETIDREGVGTLMKLCVELARSVKPAVDIGICGEHGGDPKSVEFCHEIGLDYVSCSPYRVPVARLAAAQAAIKESLVKKKLEVGVRV